MLTQFFWFLELYCWPLHHGVCYPGQADPDGLSILLWEVENSWVGIVSLTPQLWDPVNPRHEDVGVRPRADHLLILLTLHPQEPWRSMWRAINYSGSHWLLSRPPGHLASIYFLALFRTHFIVNSIDFPMNTWVLLHSSCFQDFYIVTCFLQMLKIRHGMQLLSSLPSSNF